MGNLRGCHGVEGFAISVGLVASDHTQHKRASTSVGHVEMF